MDLSYKNPHSFWTVKEIVQLTGLSERTIRAAIAGGELGSVKIKGSRKIRHSQLIEFLGFDPLQEASLCKSITQRQKVRGDSPTLPLFPQTEDEDTLAPPRMI
jgi:excisionase family DNA binding protein